jgi:hypothetical protein
MSIEAAPLAHVVARAGLALSWAMTFALPPPRRDPLAIALPPALDGQLNPAALTSLSALYLFSQLDQAGLIVTLEALVDARADLSLRDDRSAEELDKFALEAHALPTRSERESIYARLFGMGAEASLAASGNHDFPAQMAAVCSAILHLAESFRSGTPLPSAGLYAPLQFAAQQLFQGLALHAGADVTYRTRRIHDMLVRALSILGLEGITSYFGARDVAGVVQTVLGSQAESLSSAQRRGVAGQQLIVACGHATSSGASPTTLVTGPNDTNVQSAATWLASSGSTPSRSP